MDWLVTHVHRHDLPGARIWTLLTTTLLLSAALAAAPTAAGIDALDGALSGAGGLADEPLPTPLGPIGADDGPVVPEGPADGHRARLDPGVPFGNGGGAEDGGPGADFCDGGLVVSNDDAEILFDAKNGTVLVKDAPTQTGYTLEHAAVVELGASGETLRTAHLASADPANATCSVDGENALRTVTVAHTVDVVNGTGGVVGTVDVTVVWHFDTTARGVKFDLRVDAWPWADNATDHVLAYEFDMGAGEQSLEPTDTAIGFRDGIDSLGFVEWATEATATYLGGAGDGTGGNETGGNGTGNETGGTGGNETGGNGTGNETGGNGTGNETGGNGTGNETGGNGTGNETGGNGTGNETGGNGTGDQTGNATQQSTATVESSVNGTEHQLRVRLAFTGVDGGYDTLEYDPWAGIGSYVIISGELVPLTNVEDLLGTHLPI